MRNARLAAASSLLMTLILAGCAGSPPETEFAPCPSSPNCVSSKATDEEHIIGSFRLAHPKDWTCLIEQAQSLPGEPDIVVQREDYVRIEYTSATMRFVDDLELKKETDAAQVRSASRLGYRDFGVNRKRVMGLHSAYREKCIIPRI